MKKLLFFILLPLIFSCGGNSSENLDSDGLLENFSYSMDTVLIDSGDDFIYLKNYLNTAAITPDRRYLYNYNSVDSELEVIDLDQLRLKEKIKLDTEGPKGTGNPVISLQIAKNGDVFFLGFAGIHQFDSSLDTMIQYSLRRQKYDALASDEFLDYDFSISEDGQFALVAYGSNVENMPKPGLAVISLKDLSLRKVPLKVWESLQPFVRSLIEDGELRMQTIEKVNLAQVGNRLLLSSGNFNEVYVLDLQTDSVRHISYSSKLTKDSKSVPEKTVANSNEEMRAMFDQANREVEFRKFYFDDKSRKYFRFSRDVERTVGDSIIYKSVMTLFDEDLNQIHEEEVPINIFDFKFFKDGKLWSYVNVDDELGFAVIDFKF